MTSAGLNSLWQKDYQISIKNWIFDDLFYKKGLLLVIWVLGLIKPLWSVDFLMKLGCRGHWGHWGHWGCRGFRALENHYLGLQSHPGIWIQLYFNGLKKVFWGRIMKYHIEFKHLFYQRLLRPVNITFLKTYGRTSNVHTSWSHYAPKF